MASCLHRGAAPAACSWQPHWGCASARPSSGASEMPLCRALLLTHKCRPWEAAGGSRTLYQRCPWLAPSPLQEHRDPQGSVKSPLPIDEGTPWHFQGRLWMREAQHSWSFISSLPTCPHCSGHAPLPGQGCPAPSWPDRPHASIPPCFQPGSAGSPSLPHAAGSPSLFPFPGKGEGASLISSPCPADEPGDCDELWAHRASTGFLAPAGQLGAIARLLPAQPRSRPAVPRATAGLQRAPGSDAGTATQTPTLPWPPHRWIPSQRGRRERGEGTGQ